jgi:outer membrane protein
MKNLQTILNVIFGLAIIGLFILQFNSKAPKASLPAVILNDTAKTASLDIPGKVLYVNIDTLNRKYDFITKQKALLEKQQAQAEATLTAKGQALERQIMEYQKKAQSGVLTAQQSQEIEKGLAAQQDVLMKQRDKLGQDLADKTSKMQEELNKNVKVLLKPFLEEHHADYLLGYSENGTILLTNEKLDVTKEVLEILNNKAAKK